MAIVAEPKTFIEAIVFTEDTWPMYSDERHSIAEEAWTLRIEA
jgi:hypothetical protein